MLRFDADLAIDVAGQHLHLTAKGKRLRLKTSSLRPLLEAGATRQQLSHVADLLNRQGVSLELVDSVGSLVVMGNNVNSWLGKRLTGSCHVELKRPLRLLWRYWRS